MKCELTSENVRNREVLITKNEKKKLCTGAHHAMNGWFTEEAEPAWDADDNKIRASEPRDIVYKIT